MRGRFAYAAGGWGGGFSVIDISIPENPLEVGWIGQRRVLGLDVVGSYAYLAQYSDDRSNGHLRVVDVSIPEDPVVVGLFEVSLCHADDVVVVGNRAFLETCHGLRVIDVADPTNPVESEWIDLNSVDSLTISKGVGYFVDRMGHLCALDLSEPSSPTELGISQIIEAGDDIDLVGDLAYVVGSNGLEIFDVSGCKAARPISPMPRRARGLSLPSSGGE